MATTLPVRINFRLPDGWRAVAPDAVGEPDMAFVALHPESGANLTISGILRLGGAPLAEAADESVASLRRTCSGVRLVECRDTSGQAGLTQVLELVAEIDGVETQLTQAQVFLSFPDVHDAGTQALVRFVLTSPPAGFQRSVQDFRSFLRTIRPADPEPRFAGASVL